MSHVPADHEEGKVRENERAKEFARSQTKEARMAIFGLGTKKDTRPVDVGLASLLGTSEGETIEFWKKRLVEIAQIPTEVARIGAYTPQMRELSRIDDANERKRLTRARLIAFAQLPDDQRQILANARAKARAVDAGVMDADEQVVNELLPTMDENVRRAYPKPS